MSRETLLLLGRSEGVQGRPCWTPGPDGRRPARPDKARGPDGCRGAAAGRLGAQMAADGARRTTYLMAAAAEETGREGRAPCARALIELVFPRESLVPPPGPRSALAGEALLLAAAGGRSSRGCPRENRFRSSLGTGAEAGPWDRISPCSPLCDCPEQSRSPSSPTLVMRPGEPLGSCPRPPVASARCHRPACGQRHGGLD